MSLVAGSFVSWTGAEDVDVDGDGDRDGGGELAELEDVLVELVTVTVTVWTCPPLLDAQDASATAATVAALAIRI